MNKLIPIMLPILLVNSAVGANQPSRDAATLAAEIEAELYGCDNFDENHGIEFSSDFVMTYYSFRIADAPFFDRYVVPLTSVAGLSADQSSLICKRPSCMALTSRRGTPAIGNMVPEQFKDTEHRRSQVALPVCMNLDAYVRLKKLWKELIDAVNS